MIDVWLRLNGGTDVAGCGPGAVYRSPTDGGRGSDAFEYALDPAHLEDLFVRVAGGRHERERLFSPCVDRVANVVCRVKPSVHAAHPASVGASSFVGRSKLGPNRIGVANRSVPSARLNTLRTCWMKLRTRTGPQFRARCFRRSEKSSGRRSAMIRLLPNRVTMSSAVSW